MNFAWLRLPLVTTLCLLPALASAGGGGGSSDSGGFSDTGVVTTFGTGITSDTGDTESGTDTGGTDTGDTGATDTGEGSSSGEVCGECTDSEDPVQIVSPANGAVVGTLFEVQVTAPYTCVCDTCGCYAADPSTVGIRIDGSTYETCNGEDCITTDHTFTVMLGPGEYTIDALAPHDGSPEFSAPITVTVEGEVATGSTGDPPPPPPPPPLPSDSTGSSADSSGTSAGANDDGGSGGCGCTTQSTPRGALGGLLALVGLLGLRRQRRA